MSKIEKRDYYFGAGLAALFRINKDISPSIIENITNNGRDVIGTFYKITTTSKMDIIIYLKFTSKQNNVDNLLVSWEFSLSKIEKDKIQFQIDKDIPFFIILICPDIKDSNNMGGDIAVLSKYDYAQISSRSNIILGLWDNKNKVQRQKQYVIKKNTKAKGKEAYISIKRNRIETPLEKLVEETYPNSKNNINDNIDLNKQSFTSENNQNHIDNNKLKYQNNNPIRIVVSKNPKFCNSCHSKCITEIVTYVREDKANKELICCTCENCKTRYIHENFYKTFSKTKWRNNIIFI